MGKAIFWISVAVFLFSLYEIFTIGFGMPGTAFIIWCMIGAASLLSIILSW